MLWRRVKPARRHSGRTGGPWFRQRAAPIDASAAAQRPPAPAPPGTGGWFRGSVRGANCSQLGRLKRLGGHSASQSVCGAQPWIPQAHGSWVGTDSTQRKQAYEMSQARASVYAIHVTGEEASSSSASSTSTGMLRSVKFLARVEATDHEAAGRIVWMLVGLRARIESIRRSE